MEQIKKVKRVQSTAVRGKQTSIPVEVQKILNIQEDSKLEWLINDETKTVTVKVLESSTDILKMFGGGFNEHKE